jgi:hypothetical protein
VICSIERLILTPPYSDDVCMLNNTLNLFLNFFFLRLMTLSILVMIHAAGTTTKIVHLPNES